jgi:hypothetical protein
VDVVVVYSRYYPDICWREWGTDGCRALPEYLSTALPRQQPTLVGREAECTSDVRCTVRFHDMACFGRPELTAGDLRVRETRQQLSGPLARLHGRECSFVLARKLDSLRGSALLWPHPFRATIHNHRSR